ncbi:hypothetical protein TSUD_240090 [Trifolium subterraneum]|uniref:Aminotransferase-like plant mobile domain-containing protein n=1 Tax=Trifolium subterraneum TaxID=3900 RepID=A0A2Z6LT54_TRISU|nr:hypothetical protein TSUD_240090 [Trifolium subterraneum]
MADSSQTSEELPIAGKWWRDELKGCESTQVLEPSRRNKEIWEKQVIFPYSLDNKTYAFGGPKPHENNRNKETISFFPSYSHCNPRTFVTGAYNFSYLKPPNKIFRSAPTIVEGYIAWLDRVQQDFGSLWKDFGIFDFIQLSRLGLKYQQEMIIAALHFFESSTNTFQFECGMITPTLFDVAAITGLPPTGETYDHNLAGSKIEPKIRTKSYNKYIEEQNQLKGEVSDEEHVAFLALWLSQHVFCTRSLQVAKMFFSMAIQLHEGQQFGFGKLILGCLYENMRSVCENIKRTGDDSTFLGSGPFWLLLLWLNATFRVEMDLFLPELHNEEVAKRQIEEVRLTRLIPRIRGLTYQQLFLQYFEAFLGLKEFKERFAPFADRQIGPSWFIHPFPPLPESEEYQNTVWSAFLTPTVISCRFGLKSTEFGLVGYFPNLVSRQFEPQFYALLKKFEGLEYELTPFHFEISHAYTVDFARWWNLHYESQMVDVVVLRSAIEAGFNAQAIRKIKSTLNARGSKSKAESNSLAKSPFPPVKTGSGATTRKRAATAEAGGPSKKARPEEIVVLDDDVVVEVEEKQSTPAPKVSHEDPQPESELRRKRKHEQPKPLLEETHTTPSEKEEKKEKKKKKKDKDSKGKNSPPKDGVPTGNASIPEQASPIGEEQTEKKRRKKKKKKNKKSHSQSDPSVTNTSKLNLDMDDELKHQKASVDPDSTPKKTFASHSPKHPNLGQGGPSSTVLVPEISPDSIVKTVVGELQQQLEHTGEGELSPTNKTVEDLGVPTRNAVSNLDEISPPKASTEDKLTVEAGSSQDGEIKDLDTAPRETLATIPEQTTPKNSNESNLEVVGTPAKTKELNSSGVEKGITENVDIQVSRDENLAAATTQTQVEPPVEDVIAAQTNPNPPLTRGPMMEFSQPSEEDNAEATKVMEDVEGGISDKGEHSSTKDPHPSKSGHEDEGYEATDDFLNSSAGYTRTARTDDSIDDDGTSVSKPTSDFFLPSHVLQSVKDLAPEEALDTLLKTYGSEIPISEEDKQKLEDERKGLELHFQKTIIEGDMLSYVDQQSAVYFNLRSLFTTLQRLPISEALSFQITQAENLLEQYARSLQHFNRLTIDLNKQIEARAKHFDLASQGNEEVNTLKATSASAFLQISACEDNIARWKSEIRELENKIGQEEERKKHLEAQAVEVPKATIEEKAKTGIHHYSEALRAGVEMDRLGAEKNAVQRKLAHIKSLYDQFRQAHI